MDKTPDDNSRGIWRSIQVSIVIIVMSQIYVGLLTRAVLTAFHNDHFEGALAFGSIAALLFTVSQIIYNSAIKTAIKEENSKYIIESFARHLNFIMIFAGALGFLASSAFFSAWRLLMVSMVRRGGPCFSWPDGWDYNTD
jgi:hypothetical protein